MKRLASLALPSLFAALAACGRAPEPTERTAAAAPPPVTTAAVVYGADDRVDWFEVDAPELSAQVRASVAAMIPWGQIDQSADGTVAIDPLAPLGATAGLCADQRFWDQPTSASCSGTLIDDQLVLTAGHCVTSLEDCASYAWVFDYLYESTDNLAAVDGDDVYRCVSLVVASGADLGDAVDVAVVQLDRPVVRRPPAAVSSEVVVPAASPLVLPGFPSGLPLKVDTGGAVADPRAAEGDFFVASVDAFHGHSGSGVLDAGLAVVGVLTDGAEDYVTLDSCAVVNVLDPEEAEESVAYAHHAVSTLCAKGYPSAALCGLAASCGDGFCTDGEDAATCAGDCTGLAALPPAWACNSAYYDADDGCDCGCGAPDPDCADASQDLYGCAPDSACTVAGDCTIPIPAAWACDPSGYGSGQDCDCDCGAPDPDCGADGGASQRCAPGGVCQADGTCTISIPAGWSCRRRWYAAEDGCDCGCGAYDPDCADPTQEVYHCVAGSACLSDGSCAVALPSGWICPTEVYGAGDGCDCNCGARDPDCDAMAGPALNCADGLVCDGGGRCVDGEVGPTVEPVAEAGPEPGPEPTVEPVPEPMAEGGEGAEAEGAEDGPDTVEVDAAEADAAGSEADSASPVETTPEAEVPGVYAQGAGGCAGGDAATPGAVAAAALVAWLARRRIAALGSPRPGRS